jgi:hypothetical protein
MISSIATPFAVAFSDYRFFDLKSSENGGLYPVVPSDFVALMAKKIAANTTRMCIPRRPTIQVLTWWGRLSSHAGRVKTARMSEELGISFQMIAPDNLWRCPILSFAE